MKFRPSLTAIVLLLGIVTVRLVQHAPAAPATDNRIERGRYLVESVAVCGTCHTPKNDQGDYDRSMWLQGDVLDFKPVRPMPFAVVAPGIVGLPTFTNDDLAIKFFETGTNSFGRRALPPMPQFRLNHEDAAAVVVYLRSLKQ